MEMTSSIAGLISWKTGLRVCQLRTLTLSPDQVKNGVDGGQKCLLYVSVDVPFFSLLWVGRVVVNQEGNLQYSGDSFLIDWTSCLPTTNTHSLS